MRAHRKISSTIHRKESTKMLSTRNKKRMTPVNKVSAPYLSQDLLKYLEVKDSALGVKKT